MPGERTAKRFDEISHLFLSSRESRDLPTGAMAEVTLWLAIHGQAYNRAFVAAGVAEALSRLGVRCTLVEIGRGLPNVGYYFALEPRDYLAPTLDESRVVAGTVDSRIRFVYAADPERAGPVHAEQSAPEMPHVIVTAFRYSCGERVRLSIPAIAAAADRFSNREGGDNGQKPDGVTVFTDSYTNACAREIDGLFHLPYPEAVLFVAERYPTGKTGERATETAAYPHELQRAWGRRSPPEHRFFTDLATHYLQVLSHRRKRGTKHAAV